MVRFPSVRVKMSDAFASDLMLLLAYAPEAEKDVHAEVCRLAREYAKKIEEKESAISNVLTFKKRGA